MQFADLDLRRAVGAALRSLRKQYKPNGISQERLALEANVSRSYMSELERGLHDPGLYTLCRLADALGISLRRLVGEIERNYKPH